MDALLKTVLVATDGSEPAARALTFAIGLARKHGATLVLCTSVDTSAAISSCASPYGFDAGRAIQALEGAAREILVRASATATVAGVAHATMLLSGSAAAAILDCAEAERCDAIVVGTHGRGAVKRLFLGSTAADVLRRSNVPVFIVPPHADARFALAAGRVLVAVDASEPGDAALNFAESLAQSEGASLVLCTAVDTRDLVSKASDYGYDGRPLLSDMRQSADAVLERASEHAAARHVTCEQSVVNGEPAGSIAAAAAVQGAGMIVIGTHGRRGLERLFLGSVAEGVVRQAAVPVAVVRAPHAPAVSV
jgi:nucleotide-binding universal stress UspA family protein